MPQLTLKWKAHVDHQYYSLSSLTSPVTVSGLQTADGPRPMVFVARFGGTVFGLDAVLPGKGRYQGTFLCPNGITATPVVDKANSTLYVLSADGALFGLHLATGKTKSGPLQFVAPYAKALSLNLVDGVVYTTLAQGCGNALSGVYSIDVHDPHRTTVRQVLLSNTDTAGIWGPGGPVISKEGIIYGGTADGHFDAAAGDYSDSVVAAGSRRSRQDGQIAINVAREQLPHR